MFVIDSDSECLTINHTGESFTLTFFELDEIGIDFSEEHDYILHIRCDLENHYFQFDSKKEANDVLIAIVNQTSR
jgi:hypothetical protein